MDERISISMEHYRELLKATPEPLSPSPEIRPIPDDLHDLYVKSLGGLAFIGEYENEDDATLMESETSLASLIERVGRAEATTQSPEIRYQLRNWHHVTCAGFGGQACTCLEQREALIAELAAERA